MSGPSSIAIVAAPDCPGRLFIQWRNAEGEVVSVTTLTALGQSGKPWPTGMREVLVFGDAQ